MELNSTRHRAEASTAGDSELRLGEELGSGPGRGGGGGGVGSRGAGPNMPNIGEGMRGLIRRMSGDRSSPGSSRSNSRRSSQEVPLGSGRGGGAEGPGSGGSGGKDKDRDRTLRDAEAEGPESPARVRTPKHPNGAADPGGRGPPGSQAAQDAAARRAGPQDAKRAGEGAGSKAGPAPTKEGGFFEEYGVNRYHLVEIIGKGSYGVVASAIDSATGEMVAIKKINNVFEHQSDAIRILREIKLVRLLKHPNIVEIKNIVLPPSPHHFQDIYVVFELMESDLHQVIKANSDLTDDHHRFFLYQLLRGMKFIHSAKVFHRDLKPKNILANSDCKLKICDFGLARPNFNDAPHTVFWTDYVATRWYRAPELCGSFFAKYQPAVDIWSLGCIFAEVLRGKPLFPGKNVVDQLNLITDILGAPDAATVEKVRNEKAKRFLRNMPNKEPIDLFDKFPNASHDACSILKDMLTFDADKRPSAETLLQHPYFDGLVDVRNEPAAAPVSKLDFAFDTQKVSDEEVRKLLYEEILHYHPKKQQQYLKNHGSTQPIKAPSAIDRFRREFKNAEMGAGSAERSPLFTSRSLPRDMISGGTSSILEQAMQEESKLEEGGAGKTTLASLMSSARKNSLEGKQQPKAAAGAGEGGAATNVDQSMRNMSID